MMNKKAEKHHMKVETLSPPSTHIPKSFIDLGVWTLFMFTWLNISVLVGSSFIKQALPVLTIVTLCLVLRTFIVKDL